MADILKPDLCIIGAGGLGVNLAIKARQRGLATILVDQGSGDASDPAEASLHRAALAASAAQAQAIRTGARLGLDNALPKINYRTIADHTAARAAQAAPRASAERLLALGIVIVHGKPVFTDRQTMRVGDTQLKAGHWIFATGSTPLVPELPGLADIAFFTADTILANIRKLSHLLVVGSDAPAFELAQAYRRLGSEVTLVPNGPILAGYDPETTAILLRHLREEGMAVLDGASITGFSPRSQGIGVTLVHADGRNSSLDISHVLLAAGLVPDLDWAALEKARLKRQQGRATHLQLDPHGKTSHPRISAFGRAAGDDNHHSALWQGERLLDKLARRPGGLNAGVPLPRLVATQPALAQLGVTDRSGASKSGQIVLRTNLGENDAARAHGLAQGSAKLVLDRHGKIVGATMVGEGAGEVMASLAMAMGKAITAAELARLPLAGTSVLAILADLGSQFAGQQPVSPWSRRRSALRRLLP